MNKLLSFFAFLILAGWGGLSGCGKDPEPRMGLVFAAGNNLVSQSQTVTGGQVYATSLYAQTSSGNPYTRFRIIRTYDDTDSITYLDSTMSTTEFGLYFTFGTRGRMGKETWRFVITDQNNTEYSRRFVLTTSSGNIATVPFYNYTSYFYKNSAFENLQYFSTQNGTVYPGFIARNNLQVKDIVDFYFDQNAAKVISINSVATAGTTFRSTTLTPTAFTEITTLAALKNVYATNNNDPVNAITDLRKNQVVAFNTNTRSGVIRINAINKVWDANKNDSILTRMTYDVKSEK